MNLEFHCYDLELRHTFSIANYSRTRTPIVLTEIEDNGIVGYGEAALPQYLGETQDSVCNFLKKINLKQFHSSTDIESIMDYVNAISIKDTAAKASIDIALHDLVGKKVGKPVFELLHINKKTAPLTSYTIGIDSDDIIKEKIKEAKPYSILKIKVNRENWRHTIDIIQSETNKPLYIDVNQSWINKEEALDNITYLNGKNVLLIEQPMPKEDLASHAWLTKRSPIPIIADESIQRLSDMERIKDSFSGINIKLMKCTGINEAYKMILAARKYNMKVMVGCMTETSCAISAAAQLSPLADFADLDGNLLIKNDCFEGMLITNGRIVLSDKPGIGVTKKD